MKIIMMKEKIEDNQEDGLKMKMKFKIPLQEYVQRFQLPGLIVFPVSISSSNLFSFFWELMKGIKSYFISISIKNDHEDEGDNQESVTGHKRWKAL